VYGAKSNRCVCVVCSFHIVGWSVESRMQCCDGVLLVGGGVLGVGLHDREAPDSRLRTHLRVNVK
jgi:hypothetical protein